MRTSFFFAFFFRMPAEYFHVYPINHLLKPGAALRVAAVLLMAIAFSQAAPPARPSTRSEKLLGTLGTYDGEPRLPNGRIDVHKLVSELADLHANTYNWLIWHATNDWDDLKIFLPQARKKKIAAWVTLVPPSESPPRDSTGYSEPFRLDYERWTKEIARLSLGETNLIAWSLDDFSSANTDFFTPEKLRAILEGVHKINPGLAFVPCCYYPQINASFVQKYQGLFDGVLFPYLSESAQASMTDASRVEAEVRKVKGDFGSIPVFIDVYATGYSSLGKTTPEYVREVMENGHRAADGILIYCHQSKTQALEKYDVIKRLFSQWPVGARK
jgi:hypothetical protein